MNIKFGFVIQKPLDEVVSKFLNPDDQLKWRNNMTDFKQIEGVIHTKGSKNKLIFNQKELIQTIQDVDLPNTISYSYQKNNRLCKHSFIAHNDHVHHNVVVSYKVPWYKVPTMLLIKSELQAIIMKDLSKFKEYVEAN